MIAFYIGEDPHRYFRCPYQFRGYRADAAVLASDNHILAVRATVKPLEDSQITEAAIHRPDVINRPGGTIECVAQAQHDMIRRIPFKDAQSSDLVFFQGTYNCGDYITHVGIYVGNNQMYHAGKPIGLADLTTDYWQSHLVCAGRVGQ